MRLRSASGAHEIQSANAHTVSTRKTITKLQDVERDVERLIGGLEHFFPYTGNNNPN